MATVSGLFLLVLQNRNDVEVRCWHGGIERLKLLLPTPHLVRLSELLPCAGLRTMWVQANPSEQGVSELRVPVHSTFFLVSPLQVDLVYEAIAAFLTHIYRRFSTIFLTTHVLIFLTATLLLF